MKTLIATFLLSALVAILVTPVVRRFAPALGSVDLPSGRRINKKIIPRLGGIAILLGYLAPLLGLIIYPNRVATAFQSDIFRVIALLGGSISIAALGALDDIKGVRPILKVIIQILIAASAYLGGFQIHNISLPFVGSLAMGIFAMPVTVLWIVGIINAVNLIDGLDGLAAGVGFFVCVVNLTIGLLSNNILLALYAVALGGALIGFLVFNFNPATIFMGDTGSMLVGYILATTSLIGTKGGTAVALLVPVLAMGVPIFDTLLAIVRRYISRQPIFGADKGHIHHRLLDKGLTHKKTVFTLYGLSLLFTASAIMMYLGRSDWQAGVVLLGATLIIFVMMRAVGIFQSRELKQKRLSGAFDETTTAIIRALPTYIRDIGDAKISDERIKALETFCQNAGLLYANCTSEAEHYLRGWMWEASDGSNTLTRGCMSSEYAIPKKGEEAQAILKFSWTTDDSEVSSQIDILLRVVTGQL